MSRDEIHCICPFGSTYQDVKFDFVEDDLDEIVHVSYFCMPVRSPNAATLSGANSPNNSLLRRLYILRNHLYIPVSAEMRKL